MLHALIVLLAILTVVGWVSALADDRYGAAMGAFLTLATAGQLYVYWVAW